MPTRSPVDLRTEVVDGTSNTVFLAGSQLPAVQLAGFGDGSVRPSAGSPQRAATEGRADPESQSAPGLRFTDAAFGALLEQVVWGDTETAGRFGSLTLVDQEGNGIIAILIGLLQPASTKQGASLQGFAVVGDGSGLMAGAAGAGSVAIDWTRDLDSGFNAKADLRAFEIDKSR